MNERLDKIQDFGNTVGENIGKVTVSVLRVTIAFFVLIAIGPFLFAMNMVNGFFKSLTKAKKYEY